MRAVTVKAARFVITTPRLTPESPALPVEGLAQWDREPSAIPVRMLGHQPLERFEIFNGQPAPLNCGQTPRFLAHMAAGKMRGCP
jgi:hypothetical protein